MIEYNTIGTLQSKMLKFKDISFKVAVQWKSEAKYFYYNNFILYSKHS